MTEEKAREFLQRQKSLLEELREQLQRKDLPEKDRATLQEGYNRLKDCGLA